MTSKRQRAQTWLGQEAVDLAMPPPPPRAEACSESLKLGRNIWAPHAVLASLGRWGLTGTAQPGATAHHPPPPPAPRQAFPDRLPPPDPRAVPSEPPGGPRMQQAVLGRARGQPSRPQLFSVGPLGLSGPPS